MHFLIHGLDVWSIYLSMGWTWTKHLVVLSMEGFYLVIFLNEYALLFREFIDVTSPCPENFLVHGLFRPLFFFLLVDLNKSNMKIRDSHNIMYIT